MTRLDAARLGAFQGGFFGGAPAFLILFATDHVFLAAMMFVLATLSLYGWGKFFNFRRSP